MVRAVLSCAAAGSAPASGVTNSPAKSATVAMNCRSRKCMRSPPLPSFDGYLHRRQGPLYARTPCLGTHRGRQTPRPYAVNCVFAVNDKQDLVTIGHESWAQVRLGERTVFPGSSS